LVRVFIIDHFLFETEIIKTNRILSDRICKDVLDESEEDRKRKSEQDRNAL